MQARWETARDPHSDIAGYQFCVGTAPFECDLLPMDLESNLTNATSMQVQLSEPLGHEATACVTVQAVNDVGLTSERNASNCAVADGTPPACKYAGIGLGLGVSVESQTFSDVIFANVIGTEDLSSMDDVIWCVSSDVNGTCDIVKPRTARLMECPEGLACESSEWVALVGAGDLKLPQGSEVAVSAWVRNSVGLYSELCSSPLAEIGRAVANFTAGELNKFLADAALPDYEKTSANEEAEEFGESSVWTSIDSKAGGEIEFALVTSEGAVERRRRLSEVNVSGAIAIVGSGAVMLPGFYASDYAFSISGLDNEEEPNAWSKKCVARSPVSTIPRVTNPSGCRSLPFSLLRPIRLAPIRRWQVLCCRRAR